MMMDDNDDEEKESEKVAVRRDVRGGIRAERGGESSEKVTGNRNARTGRSETLVRRASAQPAGR